MRLQRLAVGAAYAVSQTFYGVDKIPILQVHRVFSRLPDGAASADVDHDLSIGQFYRQPVGKKVKSDAMTPAQQACRRKIAHRAASKAHSNRR